METIESKLIKLLVRLAECNEFEAELRSKPDETGFCSMFVNFINPKFSEILKDTYVTLWSVSPISTKEKLFITVKL